MTSIKYDFSGKVALITGSSSGIGEATALLFAKSGAKVVITGHIENDVQSVADKVAQISPSGERPLALVGSLVDESFAKHLVQQTVSHYGKIDILVNNAGRSCVNGKFGDPEIMHKYDQVMELNVRTVFHMIHLCMPHLEKSKGNIVNTASIASFVPCLNPIYSASKAAVDMLTKAAAVDLTPKGIRVNAVNPGPIVTKLGNTMGNKNFFVPENPLVEHTLLKRLGEPEEVAQMILFLASDQASYITGSSYLIDGGTLCL